MITYIAKETNDVDLIVYDEKYLTEDDLKYENRIQLEKPYTVEEKEGFRVVLFIENGELKHRYEKKEKPKEALDLEKMQEEVTKLEKATTEVFELVMGGKNEI